MVDYYSMRAEDVFKQLRVERNGLSEEEAAKRLLEYGKNTLSIEKKIDALQMLIGQFTELLVLVLIAAGVISYFVGDPIDTIAIFAIVILNGALGFIQEYKAERAIHELKKMGAPIATVRRNGMLKQIPAIDVVPGDIVQLEEGDKIPADIRFIEVVETAVDEAILTGESRPVSKTVDALEGMRGIADRKNLGYANTIVVRGRGTGIVIGTGMTTEFGKIAQKMEEVEEEPSPLKQNLEVLAKQLTIGVTVIMVLLFIVGYFIQGREITEMFLLAISLGVAAIPEGLPAITTITLALGIQRIAKHNALIKHLPSAETLGSTTVICSDKTGTLTKNEMTCEYVYADAKLYALTGVGYSNGGTILLNNAPADVRLDSALGLTLACGHNCNNAQYNSSEGKILGDPTEGAMLVAAVKAKKVFTLERVKEIPFSSERKMMSTVHQLSPGNYRTYTKGAVERVLEKCTQYMEDGNVKTLTQAVSQRIIDQSNTLSESAYRMLACAYADTKTIPENPERGLIFVGMMALRDPPREEVRSAIEKCLSAGIQVKMITGDHPLTARAIAQKVGLGGEVITGVELNELSPEEWKQVVRTHTVFARVDPEHKFKVVDTLQKLGEVVAVTGDGVNDAPAIKRADIGIAMGIKGTDVAKEASVMVLRDDNFSTIVTAVELGRTIYQNLQGFVRYLLASNMVEIAVVSLGFFLQAGEVLKPLQLLWINLATDALPALALGEDPPTKDIMSQKPRPKSEQVVDQMGPFILISGIVGTVATFAAYYYGLARDANYAGTMAFTTIVVYELVLVFNSRQRGKTMIEVSPFTNIWLVIAVLASFGLQLVAVYVPFLDPIFETEMILLEDWPIILGLGFMAILVPILDNVWMKMSKKRKEARYLSDARKGFSPSA